MLLKQDLDHEVWKLIRHHGLENKKILVAFSGGVDSLALLRVLKKIHDPLRLAAVYFHHGEDSNQHYRKEAEEFCRNFCRQEGIPFFALKSGTLAKSEAQYRELRYEALKRLMIEQAFDLIATGHHQDDLLESRLMRLIRGTGGQGLQAMVAYNREIFRPFLEVSKETLRAYLVSEMILPFEDPSNTSLEPLRNWIREEWLPLLEKRSEGAVSSLARSLETIAQELELHSGNSLLSQNEAYKTQGLSRSLYLTLSPFEQRQLLAQYLYALGKRDFSQAQLEEVQKRLDNSQKMLTFKIAGCQWEINAQQIKVQSS